ncbi:unnamed protein product [Lepeophtheirus salmonis]|uniref:(salmon louse) hypothetical protein n=1 Tax=Lepeophtheirus salmonis TaxID=72036 RepID=A0A7R8D6G2_LEPSM|nr:unnamed protein product [Lepeophtheirus salmonis]CAF3044766.1 unnamed protein product [Lepeophtheirus salmonis]
MIQSIMDSTPSILVESEEDFWRNKFYDLKSRYANLKRESRERSSKARKLILATAIKLQEKENEIQKLKAKQDEELAEICHRAEIRGKHSRPGSFRKKDSYRPAIIGLSHSVVPLDQKGILKSTSTSLSSPSNSPSSKDPIDDSSTSILENLKRSMKIEDGKDSGRESDESLVLNPPPHSLGLRPLLTNTSSILPSPILVRSSPCSPNSSFDSNDSYPSRKPPPPPPPRSIHTKLTTVPSLRKVQFSLSSPPTTVTTPPRSVIPDPLLSERDPSPNPSSPSSISSSPEKISTSVSYFEPYL